MFIGGVHHLAVQVVDVEKVARFYVETFGLTELRRFHRDDGSLRSIWVALESSPSVNGPFLAVEHLPSGAHGEQGWSMVALRIPPESRMQVLATLRQRGVTVERETGWTVYVRDPEGNLVGLSHHPFDAPKGGAHAPTG